jgi:hypothetical protein
MASSAGAFLKVEGRATAMATAIETIPVIHQRDLRFRMMNAMGHATAPTAISMKNVHVVRYVKKFV